MRRLLERPQGCDHTEYEQILVRIAISLFIAAILCGVTLSGASSSALTACLWLAAFLVTGALAFIGHARWRPGVNPTRRVGAMLLDIGCLSTGMILGGDLMAPLYPLYLWVILGMGFRYGRRYLLVSSAMGVLGFGCVVVVSEYWRSQPLLAWSLVLALLVIPAYAATLLSRLTDALEEAEQSSRAKSRFLATMSHELRTPLNAIFGLSDLLASSRLSANQYDMIATMRSAGHTLLELIDDLLNVARLESGRLRPEGKPFDLHATLAGVLRLFRHQATGKGLDLRAEYDPALPYQLLGTERWLKQILINLIGNAIKFTQTGEVVLHARVVRSSDEDCELLFIISDTGIGIAKEAQEIIFDRFVQADDSTSRAHGGSGLGLSIARQLAEMMGGTLSVESAIGKGASFRLTLRFERREPESRRLSGRVAILSSSIAARRYAEKLQSWGAEVSIARHPSEIYGCLEKAGAQRAVLQIDDGDPSSAQDFDFGKALRSWFQNDALNLVLIDASKTGASDSRHYLATLFADPPDELLFNIMHAALAGPGLIGGAGEARAATNRGGRNILVAEDNPINQKVIQQMLVSVGHSVTVVENGDAMLDRLDDDEFDLILVDLNMPELSGMDAVKLHRMAVGDDHPPFVALTADATDETRQTCIDIGFAAYITKPFDMQDVLDVVDRLSRRRPAADRLPHAKVIRPPAFADSHVTLDIHYLQKIRALDPDPEFLVEIIHDFIDDAQGLIDELEVAADRADDVACRDRAHALQSSAAHIGAIGLIKLCQQWRDIGPDQLKSDGAERVSDMRSEFKRLCSELGSVLDVDGKTGLEGHR
jgi:two-component system sensor histidine kinase RpfC